MYFTIGLHKKELEKANSKNMEQRH